MYNSRKRQKRHRLGHKSGKHHNAFKGILHNSDIFEKLKRNEEDILKFIYEMDGKAVNRSKLVEAFNNINGDLDILLELLQEEYYIYEENNQYALTPTGIEIAELIFKIHNEIEDYIRGKSLHCNAHQMAHILEHKLTEGEIENMIKASELRGNGRSLNNFNFNSGMIVHVNLARCNIWTKLISMGLFPGQRIEIINRAGPNYLLNVKGSKIAIDRYLAEGIFLIP